MTRNGNHLVMPENYLHPASAGALVGQAKLFTGKEIVLDPHWRASPSVWMDGKNADTYREWLRDIQQDGSRSYAAFVFHQEDIGAYIVYADHGQRWDGTLSSKSHENQQKVDSLCHEIGHLLTAVSGKNLLDQEKLYFSEQTAILAANIQNTVVGNQHVTHRRFPLLKAYEPAHVREGMPYDSFCVYTPCPLTLYYEGNSGRIEGKSRFLSPAGIVRFDTIAETVSRSSFHMRLHLSAMQFFGGVALQLTENGNIVNYVRQLISADYKSNIEASERSLKDKEAILLMSDWWKNVANTLRKNRGDVGIIPNIYAGEKIQFPSSQAAMSYFHDLHNLASWAASLLPNDPLLGLMASHFSRMMKNPGVVPDIKSKVILQTFDEAPSEPHRNPPTQPWGWLRKMGLI